ncbi:MAG: hypothetical protein AAF990_14055 [Bacteroidota bacterium]
MKTLRTTIKLLGLTCLLVVYVQEASANFMATSFTVSADTVKENAFLYRFNYLYNRTVHFRIMPYYAYEKFRLVYREEQRDIPGISSYGVSVVIDAGGPNPMVLIPALYFAYQRSFEDLPFVETPWQTYTVGFDVMNIKLNHSKLMILIPVDFSFWKWHPEEKLHAALSFGGKVRYNFRANLSLETSVFYRNSCVGGICSEGDLSTRFPQFYIGLAVNI